MSTRIPHLGHTALLLLLTLLSLIGCEIAALLIVHPHPITAALLDQRLQLIVNAATYGLVLLLCFPVFGLLWRRPFPVGLGWNWPAVRPWFVLGGLGLGFVSQAVTTLLPAPKDMPIEKLFRNHALIWVLVVFGTAVAPLFEEIVFRGFMLPGIAIAIDYLRLPKSLDALESWRSSAGYSRVALITSSVLTSLCFAGIHAPQLGFTWPAIALLACVSLLLCYIRIRTGSVAASTVVHGCYNFSVFLTVFVASHGFRDLSKM